VSSGCRDAWSAIWEARAAGHRQRDELKLRRWHDELRLAGIESMELSPAPLQIIIQATYAWIHHPPSTNAAGHGIFLQHTGKTGFGCAAARNVCDGKNCLCQQM
jgi:hypothetical protein